MKIVMILLIAFVVITMQKIGERLAIMLMRRIRQHREKKDRAGEQEIERIYEQATRSNKT